ncbi:hypothetical protein B488_05080 [Liberibacter crescens BT-1]|uniref:Uncharacterized protein n=1 Tax=Liberibacter crescens (strain BT-1) TaxID=1215343 RepID=L0EUJ4_LIBCB|nr:hypothetical protein [Liberibacter crescens]AGA64500.1 hypothetical protein B488_05080 [Liberibacter crescens BT-1]AMC12656.1 hypothetical protein RL73_02635 [Liberibacter crescens]
MEEMTSPKGGNENSLPHDDGGFGNFMKELGTETTPSNEVPVEEIKKPVIKERKRGDDGKFVASAKADDEKVVNFPVKEKANVEAAVADTQDHEEQEEDEDVEENKGEDEGEGVEPAGSSDGEGEEEDPEFEIAEGRKVRLSQLKNNYKEYGDIAEAAHNVIGLRDKVAADANHLAQVTQNIVKLLSDIVPAPNASLQQTDPSAYNQQYVAYHNWMGVLQNLLNIASPAQKISQEAEAHKKQTDSDQQKQRNLEEYSKLVKWLPELNDKAKLETFRNNAVRFSKDIGVTDNEIPSLLSDHRYYVLTHYAMKGLKMEEAEKKAAQKAVKAPPVSMSKKGTVIKDKSHSIKRANERLAKEQTHEAAMAFLDAIEKNAS